MNLSYKQIKEFVTTYFSSAEILQDFMERYQEEIGVEFKNEGSMKFIRNSRLEDSPSCNITDR